MQQRPRAYLAAAATVGIFFLVQVGALALVPEFDAAGFQAVENPSDPTNSLVYVGAILVATAVMLAAIKLDRQWVIRALIVLSSALLSLYVFVVLVPPVVVVPVDGASVNVLAVAAAGAVAVGLLVYPEWYVIDAAGIVMGAGAAGLFGISFGILPAILLLSVLAVYDAISVYGTEHMLTLAEGVMEIRVPVILIVPLTLSYSFLEETAGGDERDGAPEGGATGGADEEAPGDAGAPDEGRTTLADRDVFFIGLGDAVIPTVMVASAAFFAPASVARFDVPGLTLTLPAMTAMVGTLAGLLVLLWLVMKGRAHAGLPLLNGGAIGGYLIGALASGVPLLEALGLAQYL